MLWMERIAACVNDAMKKQGLTREHLAVKAEIGVYAVDQVRKGVGTNTTNVEAVAKALGLEVVADCVPSVSGWEDHYDETRSILIARRNEGAVMDRDADELLSLCRHLIETGNAGGAIDALHQYNANRRKGGGGTGGTDQNMQVVTGPLP
jgi:molybdate-binding protein